MLDVCRTDIKQLITDHSTFHCYCRNVVYEIELLAYDVEQARETLSKVHMIIHHLQDLCQQLSNGVFG